MAGDPDRTPAAAGIIITGGDWLIPVAISDGVDRRRLLTTGSIVIRVSRLGVPESIRINEIPDALAALL